MIASLEKVIALIARDPLTVQEVASGLGQIAQDTGTSLIVKPANDPVIVQASVARQYLSETPASVEITLAQAVALDELREKYGDYHPIPALEKQTEQVVFYVDPPGKPCTIALIATLEGKYTRVVTLRRDLR